MLRPKIPNPIESRCTQLIRESPRQLIFVERATGLQLFIRLLITIIYTVFYLALLPGNLFFSWKFLSLYGVIELNCTEINKNDTQYFRNYLKYSYTPGLKAVSCEIAQSRFGGLMTQRQTVVIPEVNFETSGTGCYISLLNFANIPLDCYFAFIEIKNDVFSLKSLESPSEPAISLEQWSKITFFANYPFAPTDHFNFNHFNSPLANPVKFTVNYQREPGLIMAIALALLISGTMTWVLIKRWLELFKPRQKLVLSKNIQAGNGWSFRSWTTPAYHDQFSLEQVKWVKIKTILQDSRPVQFTVEIALDGDRLYRFLFEQNPEPPQTFAHHIAHFVPVDILRD